MAAGAIFRAVPISWWLIVGLLVMTFFQGWRIEQIEVQRDKARATVTAYEQARQKAEDAAKAEKARVVKAHTAIVEDLSNALDTARRDAARLKRDSVGLRNAAEALRERVQAATATGRSEAADSALRVHAVVLEECRGQLSAVAGYADESRIRGNACERAYEVMVPNQGIEIPP